MADKPKNDIFSSFKNFFNNLLSVIMATPNFIYEQGFLINIIFSVCFLAGAFDEGGHGIVNFLNNFSDKDTGTDQAQRDFTYRNLFVGFNQACMYSIDRLQNQNPPRTVCYDFDPMKDRELHIVYPLTIILIIFGFAHQALKHYARYNEKVADSLFGGPYRRAACTILLFWSPIIIFAVCSNSWNDFITRKEAIVPYKNGDDDKAFGDYSDDIEYFNSIANGYKRTNPFTSGLTWSVFLLIIGQMFQTITCLVIIIKNAFDNKNKSADKMFFLTPKAFEKFEIGTTADPSLQSAIATPVDAAAKNPETKAKAAAAPRVTSVYANRRVTNGISF